MKKIYLTLAVFLCCLVTTLVFTACAESVEEMQAKLVGTWTEQNNLYSDVLTLNDNGSFTFTSTVSDPNYQSHANLYNGSGNYKYEVLVASNTNISNNNNDAVMGVLYLNYGGKAAQNLRVRKLTSSTLEMTNYNGDIFRFSK